jgi:pimeloyl-ACP methyl ester carboxylesterase
MKYTSIISIGFLLLFACKKEEISNGAMVSDLFYLENQGAKMPVLVEGNTASKVILIFVHGGPGGTAIGFNNDENITKIVESKYAIAYHDQRSAGISQGSATSKLTLEQYVDDLKKLIFVLRKRYGADNKIFLLSHSWGGLIAPAFLSETKNQNLVSGWINLAGAHNYQLNDELTRAYLLSFGKEQIAKKIHVAEWTPIVAYSETHVPNYDFAISTQYNAYGSSVEAYIDDINKSNSGSILDLLTNKKKAFATFWMISNAGATFFSGLTKDIIKASYTDKLSLIKVPVLNITGKYDFTVPKGLAEEVMNKIGSNKKKLLILQHSGHILMDHEPELLWNEVLKFVDENK